MNEVQTNALKSPEQSCMHIGMEKGAHTMNGMKIPDNPEVEEQLKFFRRKMLHIE